MEDNKLKQLKVTIELFERMSKKERFLLFLKDEIESDMLAAIVSSKLNDNHTQSTLDIIRGLDEEKFENWYSGCKILEEGSYSITAFLENTTLSKIVVKKLKEEGITEVQHFRMIKRSVLCKSLRVGNRSLDVIEKMMKDHGIKFKKELPLLLHPSYQSEEGISYIETPIKNMNLGRNLNRVVNILKRFTQYNNLTMLYVLSEEDILKNQSLSEESPTWKLFKNLLRKKGAKLSEDHEYPEA